MDRLSYLEIVNGKCQMARLTLKDFTEHQPELIYIAGNLTEAEQVEALLNEKQIDYALNVESFVKQSLLGGIYPGVFFYVSVHDAQDSREHLIFHGLTDTVAMDESELN